MLIHREFAQGSIEWALARAGIPTASEFDALVTPKFEPRKGETPATYLATKLAEKWIGGCLAGFGSWATDQGAIRESEARGWFELEHGFAIDRVGFITTDDGLVGASPDGLISPDSGVEIKCPQPIKHVKTLLEGEIPDEHLAQIHGGMFVSGAKQWYFVSYCPHFPPFVRIVEWDEGIQEKLAEALAIFLAKLQSGFDRLCDMNGGPPRRPSVVDKAPMVPDFDFTPDPLRELDVSIP